MLKTRRMENVKAVENIEFKAQHFAFENNIFNQVIFFLLILSNEKINQKDMQVIFSDTLQSFTPIKY